MIVVIMTIKVIIEKRKGGDKNGEGDEMMGVYILTTTIVIAILRVWRRGKLEDIRGYVKRERTK